ncbi:MAG: aminoglycoside phosphotransferase family protein [Pseudooceanicola sp.]
MPICDARTAACDSFLAAHGFATAARRVIAGDASHRRYERLEKDGATVVLMDAPTEMGEDVRPFVAIARHLSGLGLSSPEILAVDNANGFLLIEDLGDDLYARLLERTAPDSRAEVEERLYSAAIDVLSVIHAAPPPEGLKAYAPPLTADLAALPFDWYLPAASGAAPDLRADFHAAMTRALSAIEPAQPVMILRDFHAENLIWLPGRSGPARVGLLDFQDAMTGHPAYDLVSLLQDARRDVPPELEDRMRTRFAERSDDPAAFDAAYNVLGAQRNLRILGVFARLCLRDGKAHYLDFIPRVWSFVTRDLAHPALSEVAAILRDALPPPTPGILRTLRDQCGTKSTG